MAWMAIFGILGLLFGILIKSGDFFDDFGEFIWSILVCIFWGIGGLAVGALVGYMFDSRSYQYTWEIEQEVRLVSLRNSDGVHGSFFLGSGVVETRSYYFFYKEGPNGSYQLDKLPANDRVFVFEEDGRKGGVLKIYSEKLANPYQGVWATNPSCKSCGKKYEFHIPAGSLKRAFILH